MKRIRLKLVAAAAVMVLAMSGSAYAADAIESVSIRVKVETEAGDTLPDIAIDDNEATAWVSSGSKKYTISDASWVTSTSKAIAIGETPTMKVTLSPVDESEDFFKSGYKASEVKISTGTYVSAKRSGADLVVTLRVNPIKGSYPPPEDLGWRETKIGLATWKAGDKTSTAFDVYLYRGKKLVHKEEGIRSTTFNCYPYMTVEGVYTFKIRAVPANADLRKYGKKSDWEESSELIITERDVSDGTGSDSKPTPVEAAADNDIPGWYKKNSYWRYRHTDGSDQGNGWLDTGTNWYLFDQNGNMLTGWQLVNGYWYYLDQSGAMVTGWMKENGKWFYMDPAAEGHGGAAVTGWHVIDGYTYAFGADNVMLTGWVNERGRWYYLNTLEGSLEGAMLKGWIIRGGRTFYTDADGVRATGWQEIDGNWYFFYAEDGSMAVNTMIDGRYIDGDGIWREYEDQ